MFTGRSPIDIRSNALGLGAGVGLRSAHYDEILEEKPNVPWFEAVPENYLGLITANGGRPLRILDAVRRDYSLVFHGVSLSIGSVDPINKDYLRRLKMLYDRYQPMWVTDHLCWTGAHGQNLHDLVPVPFNEESLKHIAARVGQVQDLLGRRILLENVSSYFTFKHSDVSEWDFLSEVSERADCGILLDVNNIYVSSRNHGFSAEEYIDKIPVHRVCQMHLAGYSDMGTHLIDTHDHPVSDPVWKLYERAVGRFGPVATLIEWDDEIPSFERLMLEAAHAERITRKVLENEPRYTDVEGDPIVAPSRDI